MLSGLATVWYGIYVLMIGAGAPVPFLRLETQAVAVEGEAIPAGLAISFVGVVVIAVAARLFKYKSIETITDEFDNGDVEISEVNADFGEDPLGIPKRDKKPNGDRRPVRRIRRIETESSVPPSTSPVMS